ncbi:DNA-binding transcriptional activator [Saccharicrinis fermentans DSM 9555 = JCM 21142]|uniref:DNA-binding transcriptional activator n=2 Tax=Saccharicrinis fermentans TaxID=982 RepID=W7YAN0_9BACT|nr:DNA-binding transcriptional activator [Saccharicrinis fermentans DSM 9555 = JCM 21142]
MLLFHVGEAFTNTLEHGLLYKNHFSHSDDVLENVDIHFDIVRGKVGRFIANKNKSHKNLTLQDSVLTFACWIKPENVGKKSATYLSEFDILNFRVLATRQIQFNHYNKKDIDTKPVICKDVWQHIAFTLNADGTLKIYYNGDCIKSDSIQADWHLIRKNLNIGTDKYKLNANGLIDDIYIYDRHLNAQQIEKLYTETLIDAPLQHKLQAYFPLNGNTKNKINNKIKPQDEYIFYTDDEQHGLCANFVNDSCFIDIAGFKYDQQLTFTCWIKPEATHKLMSVIGNNNLVFRFNPHRSTLVFTVPLLYSKYSKPYQKGRIDDWTHLAISVNIHHKVDFYVNGKHFDTQLIEGKSGDENTLTIGQSIWKNQFIGQMSQLAIWNRALTSREIKQVYNGKLETIQPTNAPIASWIFIGGSIFLLTLIISLIYIRYHKQRNNNLSGEPIKSMSPINSVHLTHIFRAYDAQGNDISRLFSPTLIKLFSLVVLFPLLKKRHITSSELSDILWETDNPSQQKNNRSTHIHRLRKLLERFNHVTLTYQNKEWQLKHDADFFIDIQHFDQALNDNTLQKLPASIMLNRHLRTENFDSLIHIYEQKYILSFKSTCFNLFANKQYSQVINISRLWTDIAPLSELAHKYLISSLLKTQQKQEALNTLTSFSHRYSKSLNEAPTITIDDCNHFKPNDAF